MRPNIFHVEHREVAGLENLHHLAERGCVRPGKDSPLDPRVQRRGAVAADRVDQPATPGTEDPPHHPAERRIIFATNVLEHPHGNEYVMAA